MINLFTAYASNCMILRRIQNMNECTIVVVLLCYMTNYRHIILPVCIWCNYRQDVGAGGGGGGGQSRLQLGMFTIFPAFGIVLPNGHATVTVDCAPENTGKCEEVRLLTYS